ncbi:DNA cytosine methyltransferase [Frisingicoccus sp.]|uniref:DNA cytosine methyltransferase n=1 Tax=Frisingicoccus sp. TaxID=1918627 RepID=UPI00399B6AFE
MIAETKEKPKNIHSFSADSLKKITGIELFAGAGGLALGLEQAGINALVHVKMDKNCCATLKKNRPNWNVICDDIHNIDFSEYKDKIDIVSGGFPCQAFSYSGKKLGFQDTRGTLFHEFARCINETKPKMFLAENVKGLISHDKGKTFETIINVFVNLGYKVTYKVLNACYYRIARKTAANLDAQHSCLRIKLSVGCKRRFYFSYICQSFHISVCDIQYVETPHTP